MLLQCYMQNTATSRVVESEMQVKKVPAPKASRVNQSDDDYHGAKVRPNFLGQELPPCRLTYLFSKATLQHNASFRENSVVLELRKRTIKTNTKASATTTPLLVAMMYCLRRFVNS